MRSTLLLNVSYEPLSVVSAQRAVTLVVNGRATIEDASPYTIRSAGNTDLVVPYVARLTTNVTRGKHIKPPRFSRRGVLVRDNHVCAYCGKYANTIDHVVPRALGGGSTYENCVAACTRCNQKKASKTLSQMGWTVAHKMVPPTQYFNMLNKARSDDEQYKAWLEYISWYDPSAKKEKALLA